MVLITRVKVEELKGDELKRFKRWLKTFFDCKKINKIFVISNNKIEAREILNTPPQTEFIEHSSPTCPTSMNEVISEELVKEKPKSFIIASKEVKIEKRHINKLISEVNDYLCVGYKFKIDKSYGKISETLDSYYEDDDQIAYKVPWNTCIIWNYALFKKYVVEFDEICNKNPFGRLYLLIDGKRRWTRYQGMEDGLAIAKAASSANGKKIYKLLSEQLDWKIKDINKTEIKLARKSQVLLKFMKEKKYSEENLLEAKVANNT